MFEDLPDGLRDAIAEAVPLLAALHKDGISHLAFSELAQHQPGLRLLGEALMTSVDPYAHKLAAYSLGYLDDVRTDDFDRILRRELTRANSGDFMEVLNAQSAVEDLVFSAVRLAKDGRNSVVGLTFLERIVTDVVEDHQYWNTSNYAVASLMNADSKRFVSLFRRWSLRIDGDPPDHDSKPSFESERVWRDRISEGKTDQIVEMLAREEANAAKARLGSKGRKILNNLLKATKASAE